MTAVHWTSHDGHPTQNHLHGPGSTVHPASAPRPIWVKRTHPMQTQCPLYPRKRTCAVQLAMSALGQQRTLTYSITSSVRASSAGGTDIPKALAVFKLRASSS